ncbi:hypothetical protein O3G_MSEX007840 [Manduca sexta]|uniref:Uncharacterized protein n=1 Tax=Manduca sexta TaxID=7130 RepID=A0A921Z7U5_MANSE|nr:hypothetical protein O3G_MSEX007840 [Manduca sexta]
MHMKYIAVIILLGVLVNVLSKPIQDGPVDVITKSEFMDPSTSQRVKRDIIKAPCPAGKVKVMGKCTDDDPDYGK